MHGPAPRTWSVGANTSAGNALRPKLARVIFPDRRPCWRRRSSAGPERASIQTHQTRQNERCSTRGVSCDQQVVELVVRERQGV